MTTNKVLYRNSISRAVRFCVELHSRVKSVFKFVPLLCIDDIAEFYYGAMHFFQSAIRQWVMNSRTLKLTANFIFYFYFWIPSLLILYAMSFLSLAISIISKKSSKARILILHASASYEVAVKALKKISSTKFCDIVSILIQTFSEIITAFFVKSKDSAEKPPILDEMSDLLFYEEAEFDDSSEESLLTKRRMEAIMHHIVPPNPFKATIQVRQVSFPDKLSLQLQTGDNTTTATDMNVTEAESPVSFPPTPYSRARVMNRSTERVSSVMFAARDQLRLESLETSNDPHSRTAAKELKSQGRNAVFDPTQSSDGLKLSCGNHCIYKVSDDLCCTARAMLPIPNDVYTYFEFSVTTSQECNPALSIGLAPIDCPLNVMVGSWVNSIGIYSDGQLLAESKWYRAVPSISGVLNNPRGTSLTAGATVGILIYIPSPECEDIETKEECVFAININGNPIHFPFANSTLNSFYCNPSCPVQAYPTVSILTQGTRVWCRFSEADIVHRSRKSNSAPSNVKVYCLDGSLILDENDS